VLARCLARGVNVVDTAPGRSDGRAETAIGDEFARAVSNGEVERGAVFVSAKGGIVHHATPSPCSLGTQIERIRTKYIATELFRWNDLVKGRNCIAPRFLRWQLARSRAALRLETLDAYLIDEFETYFMYLSRREALRRVALAFEALEEAVSSQEIASYGICTRMALRAARGEFDVRDVFADIVGAAESVAGARAHFRVLQVPADLELTDSEGMPVWLDRKTASFFESVRDRGILTLTTLPANPTVRLPELSSLASESLASLPSDSLRALQITRSTPGVGAALVGMTKRIHVDDHLFVARTPRLTAAAFRTIVQGMARTP
jgi:aryl-alcohol dehydrogenase-like predicted oxidoreductase